MRIQSSSAFAEDDSIIAQRGQKASLSCDEARIALKSFGGLSKRRWTINI
jgi:hypothetical protein